MFLQKITASTLSTILLSTTFFGFLIYAPQTHAAQLTYTATATPGMTYWSGTSLDRINDGDIATNGSNDYQVHPTNTSGKTITMTLPEPSVVEDVIFYNRTGCCGDRIGGADMIFKDDA